jgi:dihydrofolate reductase
MYELMVFWDTPQALAGQPPCIQDLAKIWRAADKIVYSRTLQSVPSARTRLEREFDPEAVRRIKPQAERDLTMGGPNLAAQALKAGLVDELRLIVVPTVVGGGNPWLPKGIRLNLGVLDERRFGNGMVHMRYRIEAHAADEANWGTKIPPGGIRSPADGWRPPQQ